MNLNRVSRWGTLCGVFAMLMFVTGCPLQNPCADNPCDDDLYCNGVETCTADGNEAVCGDGTPVECDEGFVCDEEADACVDPCSGVVCDDEEVCTDDECVDGECVYTNNTAECDDAVACTENDVCADGVCAGTAMVCDDADACTDDECVDGACVYTPMECPAGEACLDGVCVLTCVGAAGCDDSDLCTDDTCVGGFCVYTAAVCDDGLACTTDTCEAATGCVFTDVVCGTGEICVEPDGCTAAIPCAVDGDCDDTNLCTTDSCGPDLFCDFDAVVCDDSDLCTTDACDPADGSCVFTDIVCGAGESCVGGVCLATGAFDFTLGDDELTGTAGDDVFTAAAGTLNPDDRAIGGGGNDTLNATIVGTSSGLSPDAPQLIGIGTINFTAFNDATFDAVNSAGIGVYNAAGDSAGSLTLVNIEAGVDLAMGAGFEELLDVDFSGAGDDFALTLNGSADGAAFDSQDCGLDVEVVVAEDSFLGCGDPGTDCFCAANSVTVSGSGDLTLTGHQDGDLAADGGPYDMDDFSGMLTVVPEADVAHTLDFGAAGTDELDGVDQVTIVDDGDPVVNHSLTLDEEDGDLTVDISEIDEDEVAGDLTVVQGASDDDDTLTVILGGDGDGMGLLTAATTEAVYVVSGGTTANAIANVTTNTGLPGTAWGTITVTGVQDCDLGTVTTEIVDSTGLAPAVGLTMTAAGGVLEIETGNGEDDITGSAGIDSIDTGGGDDIIDGAAGADTIDAGDGANEVTGGLGDDEITLGTGVNTVVLLSTFIAGGEDVDGADEVTGFGSGDSIELDSGNPFADGTADLTNTGAVADGKIDIDNDGTDTTIIIDTDTTGVLNPVTIVLLGVALDDTDFTFDADTELLTAD